MSGNNDELLWNHAIEQEDFDEANRISERRASFSPLGDTSFTLIRIGSEVPRQELAPREPVVSKYGDPSVENPE